MPWISIDQLPPCRGIRRGIRWEVAPRFEPSEEVIGITDPLGYFDPLGFSKQGDFEGFLGEKNWVFDGCFLILIP